MTTFLPVAEPDLSDLERRYVAEAMASGWVSSIGAFVDRFEADFARLAGTRHCVAVANGTVALHLALVARGVGIGDEVIVPDLTFAATAAAVRHAGAEPVLVDPEAPSMGLDPELLERAVSPRTKAIIAVHLLGHPAAMDRIRDFADRRGLFVLEDAAEAHGARWQGKPAGCLGHAACFSFYGNKLITTGEGGAITTDDDAFAERVRFLKDHAMDPKRRYFHPEVGFNYRMTNLQAALGVAQIERFPAMRDRKAEILGWYREALRGLDVTLNPAVPGAEPVCWLVSALLPEPMSYERQGAVMARMKADHGVDSRPFFVPMHELPPYAECRYVSAEGGRSSAFARRGVCLPSSNRLMRADVDRVARALGEALQATAVGV